jgi:CheY-like chemotaxis protein
MSARPLEGLSVLLVEDDPDGREVLEMFLEFVGAIVRSAPTAEEGLDLLKAAHPAVVIADIGLPAHDGVWLLGQIRALDGVPRIPVIALTGRVLPSDMQRFRAAGFDAHLAKPVDLDDIAAVTATLTGR